MGVVIRLCSCAHRSSNSGTARVATEHLYGLNDSRISAKRELVSHMGYYEGRTVQGSPQRGGWVHGTLRENESLYGTRELHCSKEGFIDPLVPQLVDDGSATALISTTTTMKKKRFRLFGCNGCRTRIVGFVADSCRTLRSARKRRGGCGQSNQIMALEDQARGVVFSLGRVRTVASHAELTADKYRGLFLCGSLSASS